MGFKKDLEGMANRGYQPRMVESQTKAGAVTMYYSSEDLVKVSREDKQVN